MVHSVRCWADLPVEWKPVSQSFSSGVELIGHSCAEQAWGHGSSASTTHPREVYVDEHNPYKYTPSLILLKFYFPRLRVIDGQSLYTVWFMNTGGLNVSQTVWCGILTCVFWVVGRSVNNFLLRGFFQVRVLRAGTLQLHGRVLSVKHTDDPLGIA